MNDKVIVVGDFNLPRITDSKFSFNVGGELYYEFKRFLQFHSFNLHNDIQNVNNRT